MKYLIDWEHLAHCLTHGNALQMPGAISLDMGDVDGREGVKGDSQKWYPLSSNMVEVSLGWII